MSGRKLRHTLVYSNKSWEDTIFAKQLLDLQKQYPGQLRTVFCLTRESNPAVFNENVFSGRVSKEIMARVVEDASHQFVFACGPSISVFEKKAAKEKGIEPPPRFLESVLQYLAELGFPPERIKRESYG